MSGGATADLFATRTEVAEQQRDAGVAASARHAETVVAGWGEEAFRLLKDYSVKRQFTSEDFRDYLATIPFACPVPKALGAVFVRAARAGIIRRVGFGISKARHLSPCPMWAGAGSIG